MELLASNQPWNLIMYMVIPVVLAETIAITELYLLFTRNFNNWVRKLNKYAGIVCGVYFFFIFLNLFFTAFIPLTTTGGWRGVADILAVSSYLLGVVPLFGIDLLELGLIKKGKSEDEKLKTHVFFVALFLVVAHIAMIFGMVNPTVLGFKPNTTEHMNQMDMKM
jgi:hypothetical protein